MPCHRSLTINKRSDPSTFVCLPTLNAIVSAPAITAGRHSTNGKKISHGDAPIVGQSADNILSIWNNFMAQSTPSFKRFHLKIQGQRTTISLDSFLAELLALKLGAEPSAPDAHRLVRLWLQKQADEFAGTRELNMHLMRSAILAISDNMLFERASAKTINEKGENPPAVPPPPKVAGGDRFVLFRAANSSTFPPDILVWGNTIEDVRDRAKKMFEDNGTLPKILRAELITSKHEQPKGYFIRRASMEVWKFFERMKKKRRDIRPVVDSKGVWRTRKEIAEWRKTHLWESVFKPALERKALKPPQPNVFGHGKNLKGGENMNTCSKENALEVAMGYFGTRFQGKLEVIDSLPVNCKIYGKDRLTNCWVVPEPSDTFFVGGGHMLCISKENGKILYFGPSGGE